MIDGFDPAVLMSFVDWTRVRLFIPGFPLTPPAAPGAWVSGGPDEVPAPPIGHPELLEALASQPAPASAAMAVHAYYEVQHPARVIFDVSEPLGVDDYVFGCTLGSAGLFGAQAIPTFGTWVRLKLKLVREVLKLCPRHGPDPICYACGETAQFRSLSNTRLDAARKRGLIDVNLSDEAPVFACYQHVKLPIPGRLSPKTIEEQSKDAFAEVPGWSGAPPLIPVRVVPDPVVERVFADLEMGYDTLLIPIYKRLPSVPFPPNAVLPEFHGADAGLNPPGTAVLDWLRGRATREQVLDRLSHDWDRRPPPSFQDFDQLRALSPRWKRPLPSAFDPRPELLHKYNLRDVMTSAGLIPPVGGPTRTEPDRTLTEIEIDPWELVRIKIGGNERVARVRERGQEVVVDNPALRRPCMRIQLWRSRDGTWDAHPRRGVVVEAARILGPLPKDDKRWARAQASRRVR